MVVYFRPVRYSRRRVYEDDRNINATSIVQPHNQNCQFYLFPSGLKHIVYFYYTNT